MNSIADDTDGSELNERTQQTETTEQRGKSSETLKGVVSKGEEDLKCFRCGEKGHIARRCSTKPLASRRNFEAPRTTTTAKQHSKESLSMILDRVLCTTMQIVAHEPSGLFGNKSIIPVEIMGLEWSALLDAGSETSMVSLTVFQIARSRNVDTDAFVERIPQEEAVVRNASGVIMKSVDTAEMEVTIEEVKKKVAFHVGKGLVILGTNALATFNIFLSKALQTTLSNKPQSEELEKEDTQVARVQRRIFLPPGSMKMILSSTEGVGEIPMMNTTAEPVVLHKGEVLGVWRSEEYVPRAALEEQADMPEKPKKEVEPRCRVGELNEEYFFESEADLDKKRFLMRNTAHTFVTIAGAEKAFVVFKRYCDHVIRALLAHDGSTVALAHNGGVNIQIVQLNDLTSAGIRFAQTHSWEDVTVGAAVKASIIWLPSGFRSYSRVTTPRENVTVKIYNSLMDIWSATRENQAIGLFVFVIPTSNTPYDQSQWIKLSAKLAAIVRNETNLAAVSGPQGEQAWENHRHSTIESFQFIRDAAATMKHNVVTAFNQVPEITEPFVAMGSCPRYAEEDAYPSHIMQQFFAQCHTYLKSQSSVPLYDLLEKGVSRSATYKRMKRPEALDGLVAESEPVTEEDEEAVEGISVEEHIHLSE
ncbi:zinc knuckle [Oesophagostomum dentatum]|uniref:Zinc knuckle n=1 Tax=Oesophagostomum dentatum TaxID=61180 RepID=A0A0B1SQM1_OESDE|nr:zinc knuckle [Oesophagostomum dentatum]